MNLQAQHLTMLLQLKSWAPPCNQVNMPALHPVVLTDLFEHGLIDRDDAWQVVLTQTGEQALLAAVDGMRAVARHVAA